MDLVDIDKVLDDLELNEDNSDNNKTSSKTSNDDNTKNIKIGVSTAKPTIATTTNKQSNETDKQIPQSSLKNNYVNVSNVFSSLNEYVNAGFNLNDELEKENDKIELKNENKNLNVCAVNDNDDDEQTESLPKDDCESESQSSKLLQDQSTNSSDSHPTPNLNINLTKKVKTKKRSKMNRNRKSSLTVINKKKNNLLSSSSTSSTSSLSHTSPASSRTISSQSSGEQTSTSATPTSSCDDHDNNLRHQPHSTNKNMIKKTKNLIPSSENNHNNHSIDNNDSNNQINYSSISKTNTIFSSSSSYCYNENNSSSVTFSNDIVNLDETSSLSSLINLSNNLTNQKLKSIVIDEKNESQIEEEDEGDGLRAKKKDNKNDIDTNCNDDDDDDDDLTVDDKYIVIPDNNKIILNSINQLIAQKDDQKVEEEEDGKIKVNPKIIGFESTMDDVSDTELESYLQEFEFESMSTQGINPTADIVDDLEIETKPVEDVETKELEIDDKEEKQSKLDSITQNGIKSVDIDNNDYADDENGDADDISTTDSSSGDNKDEKIDNISQASTVECNEIIESHTDFDEGSEIIDKINEIVVSAEVETDIAKPIIEEKQTETINESGKSENTNAVSDIPINLEIINENIEINSLTEIATAGAVVDVEEVATNTTVIPQQHQPKRPNTLNFPTPIEQTLPGQTPASTHLPSPPPPQSTSTDDIEQGQLSSTSSSDEPQQHQQQPIPTNIVIETGSGVNDGGNSMDNSISGYQLGKIRPYWVPDNNAVSCMLCNTKFSLMKRRHHCRACGKLLCSTCCSMKGKLEYLGDADARICIQCDVILNNKNNNYNNIENYENLASGGSSGGGGVGSGIGGIAGGIITQTTQIRSPNPNNPMEYCSIIPPHQQQYQQQQPISVMVPVGVLKREGATPKIGRKEKNVIFSDGIRPGCDLTELDTNWGSGSSSYSRKSGGGSKRVQTPPDPSARSTSSTSPSSSSTITTFRNSNIKIPHIDEQNKSYIPKDDNALPPIFEATTKTDYKFTEITNNLQLITRLQQEELKFAIQRNFFVRVKIIQLSCCINKIVINFTTQGLRNVGQDEIIILLELDKTQLLPKDIFLHLNEIYQNADKGETLTELGFSMPETINFLGSKEHGGFLYIRPTFQCLQSVIEPEKPYLIGILIHRWEVPWAKVFPLRLMLRLGALYRYYPSPHVSERLRDSVYAEIAQTLINFLADFRTYAYTLPSIRGMSIHMEDRKTTVRIPKNRYDQMMKAINYSSDHILAMGGNFSKKADGHLVCIQNTESGCPEMYSYSTQAINIQGQPRKVTGASFLVLNGALKTTSGLSGKCSIVEDGLMVQILPATMISVRDSLKNMKDIDIVCGPVEATPNQTETVSLIWTENDLEFNLGVISPIDKKEMDGIPSIRVHKALDFSNNNHMIRWTEVFILKSDDESAKRDPVDISKTSEKIARSAATALLTFLDLLAANCLIKIGLRVTLDAENVCYEAGSQYNKLPPLYMNAMDNELIPTLHRLANNLQTDTSIILELIFNVLDK